MNVKVALHSHVCLSKIDHTWSNRAVPPRRGSLQARTGNHASANECSRAKAGPGEDKCHVPRFSSYISFSHVSVADTVPR